MIAPNELEPYIALARQHGVSRLKLGDVEIDLGPAPKAARPAAESRDTLPESLTPTCPGNCGHPVWDHRPDIGCIHGCPPRRCIPNPPDLKE
jgi:hypothetical protein